MPVKTTTAAFIAIPMFALPAQAAAVAQDQPELDAHVEQQLGVKLPLPDRPVLARGRLVWKDMALAGLCAEFDGDFSKLAGKAIYLCRHDSFAATTASVPASE